MQGGRREVWQRFRRDRRAFACLCILGAEAACVLLLPLNMEPLAYCSSVVLSACPAAGITGVFAQMFRRDTSTAARVVTLSTLLCVVTLPVFAMISEQISGLTL